MLRLLHPRLRFAALFKSLAQALARFGVLAEEALQALPRFRVVLQMLAQPLRPVALLLAVPARLELLIPPLRTLCMRAVGLHQALERIGMLAQEFFDTAAHFRMRFDVFAQALSGLRTILQVLAQALRIGRLALCALLLLPLLRLLLLRLPTLPFIARLLRLAPRCAIGERPILHLLPQVLPQRLFRLGVGIEVLLEALEVEAGLLRTRAALGILSALLGWACTVTGTRVLLSPRPIRSRLPRRGSIGGGWLILCLR